MAGLHVLVDACLGAWRDAPPPRPIGLAPEDVPEFAPHCHAWLLLHGDCVPLLPVIRAAGGAIVGRSLEYEAHRVPIAPLDDECAGRFAGRHLACRCPADLVYIGPDATFSNRRWRGFQEAVHAAGREARRAPPATAPADIAARLPSGSGVFAFNDIAARAVVDASLAAGRAVPGDVAVVGVDNAPLPPAPNPMPLTTLELPLAEQGRQLGLLLRAQIEGRSVPPRTNVPPTGLILRASA